MSSKRAVRRKACAGKVRYASPAEAELAARRRSAATHTFIWWYRCPFCNSLHIGHPPRHPRTRRKDFAKA